MLPARAVQHHPLLLLTCLCACACAACVLQGQLLDELDQEIDGTSTRLAAAQVRQRQMENWKGSRLLVLASVKGAA